MNRISRSVLKLSDKVKEAIAKDKPIVALESTIISHGLPYPHNKECAFNIERIVEEGGAVPATIAIFDGKIHVGLESNLIERLASKNEEVIKASRRDLSYLIAERKTGATTVSATMIAAHAAGIDLFVTGGIGGVHRGFESSMDVSADLEELGRTPVAVVSAGVKSILDIPRTLEYLQTKGVPVMTYKSEYFPAFFSASSGYKSNLTIHSPQSAAEIIFANQEIGLKNGLLIAVPNNKPEEGDAIEASIQKALKEAEQQNIKGAKITPFLLQRVNQLTSGRSLNSNISLVENNARVGTQIAVCLAKIKKERLGEKLSSFSMHDGESRPLVPGKLIAIGVAAVDYQIVSEKGRKFELYKSCMGHSRRTFGGVARNIAESAGRLGAKTILITALGTDQDSQMIKKYCLDDCHMGLVSVSTPGKKLASARYLAILDESHNELIGVSEMQINEELSLENIKTKYFDKQGKNTSKWDIITVDCIPEVELGKLAEYLAKNFSSTLFFEAKGQKTKWIINSGAYRHFSIFKMNLLEKNEIIEAIKAKFPEVKNFDEWLVNNIGKDRKTQDCPYTNIKCIVTDGPNQIEILRKGNDGRLVTESLKVPPVSKVEKTTGAGDTFSGVFLSLLLQNATEAEALLYARIGSKVNIESDIGGSTISDQLSKERLQKVIKEQILDI